MIKRLILVLCLLDLSVGKSLIRIKDPIEGTRVEGDIAVLAFEEKKAFATPHSTTGFWPDGVIHFKFREGHFTENQMNLIRFAMRKIEHQTGDDCVRFEETTKSGVEQLEIINGDGCWSYVSC